MNKTVLSVDDSEDDALLLRRAHRRGQASFHLEFAGDGSEALERLDKLSFGQDAPTPPALLLLDLKMPKVDGFEVLQWLKTRPHLKDIEVAVFTSSNSPTDIEKAYQHGADHYVVKPADQNELIGIVRGIDQSFTSGVHLRTAFGSHYRAPRVQEG